MSAGVGLRGWNWLPGLLQFLGQLLPSPVVIKPVDKALLLHFGVVLYLTDLHLAVAWDLVIGILLIGLSNPYGTEGPRIISLISGGRYWFLFVTFSLLTFTVPGYMAAEFTVVIAANFSFPDVNFSQFYRA